jgi:hypothetical protein
MGQLEENQTGPLRSKIDEVRCEYVFVEQVTWYELWQQPVSPEDSWPDITRGGFFGGLG